MNRLETIATRIDTNIKCIQSAKKIIQARTVNDSSVSFDIIVNMKMYTCEFDSMKEDSATCTLEIEDEEDIQSLEKMLIRYVDQRISENKRLVEEFNEVAEDV